jgi:hypothetical protein
MNDQTEDRGQRTEDKTAAPSTVPPSTVPPSTAAPAQPPPAATVVLRGTKSETEADLERQLDTERKKRRKAETDAAYLEDENRRLKSIGLTKKKPAPPTAEQPTEPPAPNDRWTFFETTD